MRRFYAPSENIVGQIITLDADETKHLRDVLRLHEGEKISVFDGTGSDFLCEIEKIEKLKTLLKIVENIPNFRESALNLTLAVALLKGEKFDWVVQKACELGVSDIIPLITKRADVKIKDKKESDKKLDRWQRISLEAAKQCGRSRLMQIEEAIDFKKFIESSSGTRLLFSERNGEKFTEVKSAEKIVAIIGSEGGWEDAEIEFAREKGVQIITLGGRILRAETAGIVISALLQNHFGDLG